MNLHNSFTFSYFLIVFVVLLAINLVLINIKKGSLKGLWSWKAIGIALIATLVGLLYIKTGASGTFNFKSYGFPRKIFEMYHIIPAFEKDAAVRTFSKMNWENLLQNFLLWLMIVNVFFKLLKNK